MNPINKVASHRGTEWGGLAYLDSLPPWNGQGGFGLEAIREVLARLGDPQDAVRSIHVAGTNGKGSVSAMIASILGAAGFTVGMTISPHLQRVNERIVLDGLSIGDEELDERLSLVQDAAAAANVTLSYFEAITAAAFLVFAGRRVDFAVVVVGLGGRLDATNVLRRPEACAIVSIDLDHEAILGSTLEEIAHEKAGILKQGVPAVLGRLADGPRRVIEAEARAAGLPLYRTGFEFDCETVSSGLHFTYQRTVQDVRRLSLLGGHQANNAAVAFMVSSLLGIPSFAIDAGISSCYWPGRLELLEYAGRTLIMDCGHNPAGMATVISFLDKEGICPDVAFAALQTKQWRKMIEMLSPYARDWCVLDAISECAVPSQDAAAFLSGFGINARAYGSDYRKFISTEIAGRAGERPLLIVGSMYMLGEMRTKLGLVERPIWKKRV